MNNTTPYPADMTEYVNKMLVKDLRDFLHLLRDRLSHRISGGKRANKPETGWWVAWLPKVRKPELKKIIIDNKFPCNAEIMKKFNRYSSTEFWEWYERKWLNKFHQHLPSSPPLEIAHEKLCNASYEWVKNHKLRLENDVEITKVEEAILELEKTLETCKNLLRERKLDTVYLIEKEENARAEWDKLAEKVDELDPRSETCSVCFEEKVTSQRVNTKCSHHVCLGCFYEIKKRVKKLTLPCPVCRDEISLTRVCNPVCYYSSSEEESDEESDEE